MDFFEIVSAVVSVIGFFSLIANILQYTKKREQDKDLYQMVLTHYNNYYLIARALTRLSNADKTRVQDSTSFELLYEKNTNFIRGVADSARIELMNFSKTQLDKDIYYQHPAYPDKVDFSDDVKMGLPPEQEDASKYVELSKKILKAKDYRLEEGKPALSEYKDIVSSVILDEEKGGIPGSNIGTTIYDNTDFKEGAVHDDQEFFYVFDGDGQARIGGTEININAGSMFVVPQGTEHSVKTSKKGKPVKVLWVHNS